MKMDKTELLLHQVGLSVSCVISQDSVNTSISVIRFPLEFVGRV